MLCLFTLFSKLYSLHPNIYYRAFLYWIVEHVQERPDTRPGKAFELHRKAASMVHSWFYFKQVIREFRTLKIHLRF